MAEVTIVRKEIIVVDHVVPDSYGNLIVADKAGNEYRVNANHNSLHPVFQPGAAVELGYGNFMNKEYIHTAVQVKDNIPPPRKPEPVPHQPGEESLPTPAPQAVGMMTKEIGDNIRANVLYKIFGKKIGVELIKWYRGQTLGITRIPFDGKDLPKLDIE